MKFTMKFNWLAFGFVLLAFCSLTFWFNGDRFRGALKPVASFGRAPGQITMSRIGAYQRRKRGIGLGKETVYSADIRFQFEVSSQIYTSDLVGLDLPTSETNPESAKFTLRKYPLHRKIVVFYDPQNPALAVLEPQNKGRTLAVLAISAVLWLVGLVLVVTIPIQRWRKHHKSAA